MSVQVPREKPNTILNLSVAIETSTAAARPAIANALWPRLRAQAWVRAMRPAPSTPVGNGPSIRTTTPPVPGPEPRWEPVDELECLYAFATKQQARLKFGVRVILYRVDHDQVLKDLDHPHRSEYRRAIRDSWAERPFYRAPELPSGWRRNYKDELITERVAAVLQLLAGVAHVQWLDPAVERSLLS